jgi:hypothetical protein
MFKMAELECVVHRREEGEACERVYNHLIFFHVLTTWSWSGSRVITGVVSHSLRLRGGSVCLRLSQLFFVGGQSLNGETSHLLYNYSMIPSMEGSVHHLMMYD